jgi:clan AA aspartic protease (TIGR02281 family)
MERKLTLWVAIPFLAIAWTVITIEILAPGLIGDLFMPLLLVLAAAGIIMITARAVTQMRAGESALGALYPIAAIVITIVLSFYPQLGAIARGVLNHIVTTELESNGVRFAAAEDGRFHAMADIDGMGVRFVVDPTVAEIVLSPDDARSIGIDPSWLTFDQQVITANGTEAAASIRLRTFDMGFAVFENLPARVTATGTSGSVLGKAFFDRLRDWRIENGTLMMLP